MPAVNFSSYNYIPSLLCGEVERMAYDHLREETKASILPVFELNMRPLAHDFEACLDMLRGTIPERPFLLDLDKRAAPPPYVAQNPANPAAEAARVAAETAARNAFNAELNRLLNASDGFANWRAVANMFPNAIPVLQFTHPAAQGPDILQQAQFLGQQGQSLAIRIRPVSVEETCAAAAQVINALENSSQILLIFDCGQGRRSPERRAEFVINAIELVLNSINVDKRAGIVAVCMSNSYPALNHDGLRVTTNCDWEVWRTARENFAFKFGDYAATNRQATLNQFIPRTWRATVVHSLEEQWLIHRHENAGDRNGWTVGSQAVSAHPDFRRAATWCDDLIDRAAIGNIANVDFARFWHAAKINGHIERQMEYSSDVTSQYEDEDDL